MTDISKLEGIDFHGWQLSEKLGAGIDGVVYLGIKKEKSFAIKIFFPTGLHKNGLAAGLERLGLQLSLSGHKVHPNLVEIFEGGEDIELKTIYIVMEFLPGRSLDKILTEIPRKKIPTLVSQLVSAAKYLDQRGLVHRDIKPANIMISPDYSTLTLLDLGIILSIVDTDDDQRLSGDEFIASLRYSPPEFVWRREVGSNTEAWKAVTFYQIGATVHDMIMQKPIFEGLDTPRANLYDAVRHISPEIQAHDCPQWLLQTLKACLIKNWQERSKLVTWDSFNEPTLESPLQEVQEIKLEQLRNEEREAYKTELALVKPAKSATSDIWNFQNKLFTIVRQFILTSSIFPKFSSQRSSNSKKFYSFQFEFEKDEALLYQDILKITFILQSEDPSGLSVTLEIQGELGSNIVFNSIKKNILTHQIAEQISFHALTTIAKKAIYQSE